MCCLATETINNVFLTRVTWQQTWNLLPVLDWGWSGMLGSSWRLGGSRETWATAAMASNNTASIAQARKLVEQLKMEANIDRIKVRCWCHRWFFWGGVCSEFSPDWELCLGVESSGRPDVILWSPRQRGPPAHASASFREPLQGEKVFLCHPVNPPWPLSKSARCGTVDVDVHHA